MGSWLRIVAGTILLLGLTVAVLLPNGYACPDGQLGRQWSYFQERWFYGCRPSADEIDRGIPFRPMDADTDRRVPLRIGAVLAGLVIAWRLVGRATDAERQPGAWTEGRRTWSLVLLYAVLGATVALLVTLRQDPYCILHGRGPARSPAPTDRSSDRTRNPVSPRRSTRSSGRRWEQASAS